MKARPDCKLGFQIRTLLAPPARSRTRGTPTTPWGHDNPFAGQQKIFDSVAGRRDERGHAHAVPARLRRRYERAQPLRLDAEQRDQRHPDQLAAGWADPDRVRRRRPDQDGFSTGQPLARQGTEDYGAQRKSVEDAILSRVEPQYAKQRDTLNANLAAQGFNVNTKGYQNAADESNRNLTDARMQAVLAGGQEQSRLFGLDQSRLGFNNSREHERNEAIQRRAWPP
jgi:hypothetical protein